MSRHSWAFRGGSAALHRQAGHPLVDDLLLDDHLARVERGVVGGHRAGEGNVVAGGGEQQGLAGEGGGRTDHRGQRLVVHADQVGGVLTLVTLIGDHDRDRLADEPHGVGGEQRLGPRAAERHRAFAHAVAAVGWRRRQVVHVAGGQHGDDARLLAGFGDVDAGDAPVRHRAAHEGHPRGSAQFGCPQVVDVDAAFGQQPRIFGPYHPGAQDAHLTSATYIMTDRTVAQLSATSL
jgi:hypothetical protein